MAATGVLSAGCSDDAAEGGPLADGGGDTGTPGETGDTGTGSGPAAGRVLASFCNPLSLGDQAVTLQLIVGEGTDAVTLSASTGTCSNRLGTPCAEVPTGPAVPVILRDADGQDLSSTHVEITAGTVYIFHTTVVNAEIGLEHGTLTDTLSCADMECIFRYSYNELTCAADDPCGWAGDGMCDSHCETVLPGGAFDDSADC